MALRNDKENNIKKVVGDDNGTNIVDLLFPGQVFPAGLVINDKRVNLPKIKYTTRTYKGDELRYSPPIPKGE